jgi:hypothetical protein
MDKPKRKSVTSRRRTSFKPKSADYMRGFHDCLDNLATLAYQGPIFLQVLATMAGSDVVIPGVDKFTREQFEKEFKLDSKKRRQQKASKAVV